MIAIGLAVLSCSAEAPKLAPLHTEVPEIVKDTTEVVSFSRDVDILFVVDDSGSMGDDQANLGRNADLFTKAIFNNQGYDFHIGVTTSSMNPRFEPEYGVGGKLHGAVKFVTRTTPFREDVLRKNLQPGSTGDGVERFYDPIHAALTAPLVNGVNKDFFRPDATLVIIIVTDTDDFSHVTGLDFYKFLLGLKGGDPDKVIVYAAYVSSTDKKCPYGDVQRGILEGLFKEAKAKTFSLCDVDFGKKLAALADDVIERVGTVLYLSRPPLKDTIVVTFGSQTIPNDVHKGWVFDPSRNALIFAKDIDLKPEPSGTNIQVKFEAAKY